MKLSPDPVALPTPARADSRGEDAMRCQATTKRGTRCQNPAGEGERYCRVHATNGRHAEPAGSRTATNEAAAPAPILETIASVLANATAPTQRAAQTPPANGAASNPLEALAAAVAAAAAKAAEEESKPRHNGRRKRQGPPEDPLGKTIYSTAYGVGYGVALPAYLLLGMLPDNALGRGLKDGAEAARLAAFRRRKK